MKTLLLIIFVLFSANSFAGLEEASTAYANGDYKTAIHWYRKSAQQGLAVAQNLLGGMYIFGQGTIQDYVRAYMWLKIAASNESTTAQGNIDKLKGMMTPSQIEQAQDLERECVATEYKDC